MVKRKTGLVLALDVTSKDRALEITGDTCDLLDAVKIGYPLVLAGGVGVIADVAEYAPVIVDFKLADIPYTNRLICQVVFQEGASGVIAHVFTGEDSLRAVVGEAKNYGGEVYAVAGMSHPGAARFLGPKLEEMACLALEVGVQGIVAPATDLGQIAEIRRTFGKLKILSPGVGVQGGSPGETVKAGADYLIVGRSIYNSKNPRKAAQEIVREIEDACEEKNRLNMSL